MKTPFLFPPFFPLLTFCLFCLSLTPIYAQSIKLRDSTVANLRDSATSDLPDSITSRMEDFFSKLQNDTPETAFFTLFQGTPFNDKKDIIDQITSTSRKSVQEFGAYTSHEFTNSHSYGEKSMTVSYLTEMPKKLLHWRFYFYSPGGTSWILANLKVDDFRNYLPRNPNKHPPPPPVQVQIEKFFVNLLSDQVRRGMQEILKDSGVPDYQKNIEEFIQLVNTSTTEYGSMQSYELYDYSRIGSHHVLLTYFSYLESEPLRWQFFYRIEGPGKWLLVNLRFDDLLDEAVLLD